jgi:hypothetical protein
MSNGKSKESLRPRTGAFARISPDQALSKRLGFTGEIEVTTPSVGGVFAPSQVSSLKKVA